MIKILNMDSENNTEIQNREKKVVIFYISEKAHNVAEKLKGLYPNALILKFNAEIVAKLWNEYRVFIFITATGIVVRTIAPLIKSKKTDPAVIVVSRDERFVISLLSGHEGGANEISRKIAKFLNAYPVITTASEIEKGSKNFPQKNLVIGIGCNSGTSAVEIEDAVKKVLEKNNLEISSVCSIATIDKKANEEGLLAFARKYNLGIYFFTPDELNNVKGIQRSEIVYKATGANAVSEPAALLASKANILLVPKQKIGNVTIAVAEQNFECKGKIFIVGIGPGSIEHITPYAQDVIKKADVIIGYNLYISLIDELIKGKEVFSTGMTQEIERCKKAIELASNGKNVVIVSSGDAGIYGMAGLVLKMLKEEGKKQNNFKFPSVEIIPGIPALTFCAAKLGAPLMNDFACISLSDRLTPWEVIEKRLEMAALADFVIVLYNPRSKERTEHIKRAREIILKYRDENAPVGIVKAATREGEKITITTLKDMCMDEIDMETTVIIGNSQTFVWNGWMITPRGYSNKISL